MSCRPTPPGRSDWSRTMQLSGETHDTDSPLDELSSGTRTAAPKSPAVDVRDAFQMSVSPCAPPSVRVELQYSVSPSGLSTGWPSTGPVLNAVSAAGVA